MTKSMSVTDFRKLPEELQVQCIDKVAKFYNSESCFDSAAIGRLSYVENWFHIKGKKGDGFSHMSINEGNFPIDLKIYLENKEQEEIKTKILDGLKSVKQIDKMG